MSAQMQALCDRLRELKLRVKDLQEHREAVRSLLPQDPLKADQMPEDLHAFCDVDGYFDCLKSDLDEICRALLEE